MSRHQVIAVIGSTGATAPAGCESAEVSITTSAQEPVEVSMGCLDFKLTPNESVHLGRLLIVAGEKLDGSAPGGWPMTRRIAIPLAALLGVILGYCAAWMYDYRHNASSRPAETRQHGPSTGANGVLATATDEPVKVAGVSRRDVEHDLSRALVTAAGRRDALNVGQEKCGTVTLTPVAPRPDRAAAAAQAVEARQLRSGVAQSGKSSRAPESEPVLHGASANGMRQVAGSNPVVASSTKGSPWQSNDALSVTTRSTPNVAAAEPKSSAVTKTSAAASMARSNADATITTTTANEGEGDERENGLHLRTVQAGGSPAPNASRHAARAGHLRLSVSQRVRGAVNSAAEGVTDEHRSAATGHLDTPETQRVALGDDRHAGSDREATGGRSGAGGSTGSLGRVGEIDEGPGTLASGGEPWKNVTDLPWTNASSQRGTSVPARPAPSPVTPPLVASRTSAPIASTRIAAALSAAAQITRTDCRPSADTSFSPSAAAWIAKANAWADSIAAKYPRSVSIYYDRLRCNGSIPFDWYMATHNPITGAAFSDQTPVEWMCSQHMDSPLAAMMVRTAPVMRPASGGPYVSVLISYNDHDVRIAIDDGTEYAGCGVTADHSCVFRAAFPCVWPMEKMYDDGKGGTVAVVSGWDVTPPGRIEVGPREAQP